MTRVVAIILFFSLIFHSLFIIPSAVYAASSPWSQTNWNGGSGQTSWSDTTKYDSASSVTTSTANQVTLTATSSWYNASWAYRKPVTITNSGSALTNFQVQVTVDTATLVTAGKMQSDCDDIRFANSSGTELSYWIESGCNSASTVIWVKADSIANGSTTIYIYYGNGSASAGSSQTDTMSQFTNLGFEADGNHPQSGLTDWYITSGVQGTAVQVSNLAEISCNVSPTQGSYFYSSGYACGDTSQGDSYVSTTRTGLIPITSGMTTVKADVGAGNGNGSTMGLDVYNSSGTRIAQLSGSDGGGWSARTFDVSSYVGQEVYLQIVDDETGGWGHVNVDNIRITDSGGTAQTVYYSKYASTQPSSGSPGTEEPRIATSGTLTSSIFDSGQQSNWGTLTYSATTPSNTSVAVKVRTSANSDMSGATAFASCTAISSGADISSNSCVTDTHRYAQYLITLGTSAPASTPTFTSYSLAFAAYDADAPSISLTALTPDPNSDNTPTLSGTATDSIGTVSNVQFQMDSTSGSWSSCTTSDGSFNSASEAFGCTAATLTDGSHTMYIRATDSNGNTTSSGYASDTFTIDATNPVSIDLDSPGDNSYTNNERPTFKWKATTDATAGLSKYVLEIDNPSAGSGQVNGDFTIDSIPTSGTSDITSNNKYVIHFDGFSDSDTTNNYISVYTRSTNDWGSSENDGKLREGRVSWKVKARDNAGNESSSSRTLFVDRTNPNVEFTQINEIATSPTAPRNDGGGSNNFSTTDKTPTIFGKITDPLAGADNNGQTIQSESGPKVASGPKEVNIKIEKKNGLTYTLVTLYKINMDNPYYTCDPNKTIDNSKQKCDKYLPFEYTPKENLELGTYKITLSGKDKADNPSSETTLTLNITTLSKITTTEEKKIIEDEILKQVQDDDLNEEQKEQIKQELEITKPTGEVPKSVIEKAGEGVTQTTNILFERSRELLTDGTSRLTSFARSITEGVASAVAFIFNKTGEDLALKWSMTEQGLSFTYYVIASASEAILNTEKIATLRLSDSVESLRVNFLAMTNSIGQGYNNVANNAPGVTKNVLLAIGNGVSTVGTGIGNGFGAVGTTSNNIADGTSSVIASGSEAISNTGKIATSAIGNGFLAMTKGAQNGITSIAFAVGEKVQDVSGTVGIAIIKFTYNFVPEPTKISDVQVLVLSPTSVKVSWLTNHPANGKVNYGLDRTYPFDQQTDKRTTHHEFTLNNLQPDTTYLFEVMSQNKNYVYDANREFRTPAK